MSTAARAASTACVNEGPGAVDSGSEFAAATAAIGWQRGQRNEIAILIHDAEGRHVVGGQTARRCRAIVERALGGGLRGRAAAG